MSNHTEPYNTFFDRQFNLMYFLLADQEETKEGERKSLFGGGKSSKFSKNSKFRNIVIHDIPKNMEFLFFDENSLEEGEFIQSFFFEQYFDSMNRTMKIEGYQPRQVVNNFELFERAPENRLLVETYMPQEKRRRLWGADKWGLARLPLVELKEEEAWHYDVYNQFLRIFKRNEAAIQLQTIKL